MNNIKKLSYLFVIILAGCQSTPPTDTASLCMYQAVKSDRILLNRHNVHIGSVAAGYKSKESVCRSNIFWEDEADERREMTRGSVRDRELVIVDPVAKKRLNLQRLNNCMQDPSVQAVNASSPAPLVAPAFRYFERMSSGLKLIDLESCPADFKVLFNEYITAWDSKLYLANQNPNLTINNWMNVVGMQTPENLWQKNIITEDANLNKSFKKIQNYLCDKTNFRMRADGNSAEACRAPLF
jgi:hypothetical protein